MNTPYDTGISAPDLRPGRLRRDSHCIFLNRNDAGEKLSGGFYDETHIRQGYFEKFDAYFAVTWILEGRGRVKDYLGREFSAEPGDLLIRHAGTSYALTGFRDAADHWLEFSAALPDTLYRALTAVEIVDPQVTCLSPGMSSALLQTARRYVELLQQADCPEERGRAYGCFLDFYCLARKLSSRRGEDIPSPEEILFIRACEMLGQDFDRKVSMRQIARRLGVGYETFRRKFVRRSGCSPMEYRIRKRLEKADSLLLQTRMPVKEIAAELGYSEVAAFTRQYVSRRNQPPGAARKIDLL